MSRELLMGTRESRNYLYGNYKNPKFIDEYFPKSNTNLEIEFEIEELNEKCYLLIDTNVFVIKYEEGFGQGSVDIANLLYNLMKEVSLDKLQKKAGVNIKATLLEETVHGYCDLNDMYQDSLGTFIDDLYYFILQSNEDLIKQGKHSIIK